MNRRSYERAHRLVIQTLTIVGLWAIGGVLLAGLEWWKLETFGSLSVNLSDAIVIGLIRGMVWAAFTPVVLYVSSLLPVKKPRRIRAVLALIPVVVLLALAREAVGAPFLQLLMGVPFDSREILAAWNLRLDVNIAVVILLVAVENIARSQREAVERERRASELEAEMVRAQLTQLRADLQPHFLFNALNGIAALLRDDSDKAERMLISLSDLLRRTLEIRETVWIQLSQELSIVSDYLELMQMRFGDRLSVRIEAGDEVLDEMVPPLLLQPLVENAIKHGAVAEGNEGRVEIRAWIEDDCLWLRVRDEGRVGESERELGSGVGLSSTRQRLELIYGPSASVSLTVNENDAVVDLAFPIRRTGE